MSKDIQLECMVYTYIENVRDLYVCCALVSCLISKVKSHLLQAREYWQNSDWVTAAILLAAVYSLRLCRLYALVHTNWVSEPAKREKEREISSYIILCMHTHSNKYLISHHTAYTCFLYNHRSRNADFIKTEVYIKRIGKPFVEMTFSDGNLLCAIICCTT